ncbi:hypothetical protein T492DRAFT_1042770 [Pavlovales sp. CCMP2436]|nr:hypothetical protein T492DRAFT_1042734 [Pavlovales sp. CCMP2436]KAJ1625059.1 hypothetical protein T492DRAFT_1042770 [Pavlovales sp. CCMP2436]|mmetsp:Transcript_229/g.613  ORF Transcript_229/g.613 Transcript_229/m.613 type:complete len:187 (-) Transcript_229:164-724(-)
MLERRLTETALTVGEFAAKHVREEGLKWIIFSLTATLGGLPVLEFARKRASNLQPLTRSFICASFVLFAWVVFPRSRELDNFEPDSHFPDASSEVVPASWLNRGLAGFEHFLVKKPLRAALITALVVATLDLTNVFVALDRADLLAGPLLRAGRCLWRVARPTAFVLWRALRGFAAKLVAFRARYS